jgi:hypothetical protein
MLAVEQRGGKGIESLPFCHLGCGFQATVIAISAPFMFAEDHALEESLKLIFVRIDHLQSCPLGVGLDSILPPEIFLVGVDVGVVEKPGGLKSRFPQPLQGNNGAIGAARMEQNLHGKSPCFSGKG